MRSVERGPVVAWPNLSKADLRSAIVLYFEDAVYEERSNDSVGRVPFRPSTAKVREIEAAIDAVSHLSGSRSMPFWIDDGNRVAGSLPPEELVPMANGLLHVPTRELHPPTPHFFCPYALPYMYDATAEPPQRFFRFLEELWSDDQQSKNLLQEFIGYLVVSDTSQQKMLLLVGPPRSGKGTISRMVRELVGHHNVAGPTLAGLATNFGLQPMIDKPVAIISDARLSGRRDNAIVVERLLSITGEDALTIDRKYRSAWTGPLPSRLVVITNELPRLEDASGALASRFLVLQLTESFLGREDHTLSVRLADELPGILLWALDGLDRLRQRGHFLQPNRSSQMIRDLQELSSPIQAFINECCVVEPSRTVAIDDLFQEWTKWCDRNGSQAGNKQAFGKDLGAAQSDVETTQPRIDGSRKRHYKGIGLARDGTRF